MLNNGINGSTYLLLKEMYKRTMNSVRVNDLLTPDFKSKMGSRQRDPGSPTHFNVDINGLLGELKSSKLGVDIGDGDPICVLAYADDVVVLAELEEELQSLLSIVDKWCKRWHLAINPEKSKVVHFRRSNCKASHYRFSIGEHHIDMVDSYH